MSYIRAELRFKNAALYNAIKETGMSFYEFAEAVKISYIQVNAYINFRSLPSEAFMNRVCDYLGLPKEELFLKYLPQYKLKCSNTIKWDMSENHFKQLSNTSNQKLLSKDFKTDLDRVLATLHEKESKVIKMFFLEEKPIEQIANEMGLVKSSVQQLKCSGIKKMRHSRRSSVLADYL